MLIEWLAPVGLPAFLSGHFQRQPYARPGAARCAVPSFGWDTLERVLRSETPLDLLTVKAGELIPAPPPRCRADVQRLMRAGVSTVVRGSERHDRGLAAIA